MEFHYYWLLASIIIVLFQRSNYVRSLIFHAALNNAVQCEKMVKKFKKKKHTTRN